MKTYRLASSPMISAPGMVRWAINGARFENDRDTMANVIAKGWGLPLKAALALVTCAVPYKIEGETVTFSVENGA